MLRISQVKSRIGGVPRPCRVGGKTKRAPDLDEIPHQERLSRIDPCFHGFFFNQNGFAPAKEQVLVPIKPVIRGISRGSIDPKQRGDQEREYRHDPLSVQSQQQQPVHQNSTSLPGLMSRSTPPRVTSYRLTRSTYALVNTSISSGCVE